MPFRILTCLLLLPLMSAADKPARDARTLRVMTYNIHTARGSDDRMDLPRIANIIKSADVDVVAIQEVDVKNRRSGVDLDQAKELAKLTGMHGVFGKGRDFQGGEYGQAILSRQPIEKMDVHPLPSTDDQEQRVALFATIPQPRPLPDLLFVATHLHHLGEDHRLRQSAELNRLLADYIAKKEPAVLLLGDLNATPDSEVMKRMFNLWTDPTADAGFTIPAEKPVKKIDYVLLPKNHGWEIVSAKTLDEPIASDHRPVVVELRWKSQ